MTCTSCNAGLGIIKVYEKLSNDTTGGLLSAYRLVYDMAGTNKSNETFLGEKAFL